jgi:KDO2-lipid IV(A) lauroyltransferase
MSIGANAARRLKRVIKPVTNTVAGLIAVGALKFLRLFDPQKTADFAGATLRRIGPWLPEHRIGYDNLKAAFPDWTEDKIQTVLRGVWDNLGRLGVEFANFDRLWSVDFENPDRGRIDLKPVMIDRFNKLRDSGRPALIFAAHLANWELPAMAAPATGLDSAVVYRRPNIARVDAMVRSMRARHMGELIPTTNEAPSRLAAALERGAHVGMLVDQFYGRGAEVTFFGRKTRVSALFARLSNHFDCAIHGVRAIRLPDGRFRMEMTEEIQTVRNADGTVDVNATMQAIISVIEDWVREHPEQWLWLHRFWR